MKLPKDLLSQTYIKPRIFLCEVDKERICQLETTNTSATLKFNSFSELTFEVGRVYNDIIVGETRVNPHYDKIEALRLVEIEGFGFFEMQGPELTGDGIKETKTVTAYSLEYTLSQRYLKNFYTSGGRQWVGSLEQQWKFSTYGSDDNSKPTKPIVLYNPSDTKASLLHLVLSEVYGWSIGHVDANLCTLSRQFDVDRESVYDFLMNEVCEKFNCYIVFDTYDNTINVYAESLTAKFIGDGNTHTFIITPPFEQVGTVSVDGYKTTKWQYNSTTGTIKLEDAPEAGAHIEVVDNALTKWETDVFVSFDNLSQEINVSYDADSIKTKLDVTYGDDHDIREVNLGVPYLVDLSYYYTVDWMGQDLYDAYTAYMQKSNGLQSDYADNSQEILKLNDQIYDLKNRLSLVYGMDSSVNAETVGTYYIISGGTYPNYSYTEVSLPSEWDSNVTYYKIDGVNVTEEKVHKLYSTIRKYFVELMGQEEPEIKDIASMNGTYTDLLDDLTETKAFDFVSSEFNKLKNALTLTTTKENATTAVSNFLKLIWNELGLTPLEQLFLAPYVEVRETNVSAGFSSTDNKHYGFYYPVNIMIDSLNDAIKKRQEEIAPLDAKKAEYENDNKQIADDLLMNKNFTPNQLVRLSAFMREDELHIEDIIETNQDDLSSSFKIKQDAMESGRIELQKRCQPQLQFAMTMANIYAMPEFEPIVHQFQLGNVIKVGLRPDYVKQSRLLQVNINFDDFSDFSCEFGELTSLRSQSDIHADLLKNAITAGKSVATNSGHWTKGSDVATAIDLKIQQGLLDATTRIQATDGSQGVVIDKYGIWLRKSNPDGSVSPYQARIVNNNMLFSSDGFKTSRMGIGEFSVVEGENDQTFYGIIAEALVGRLILGTQLEIGNEAGTMTFDNGGFTVTNGKNTFNVDPNSQQLLTISKKTNDSTEDIFYVDENGKLHISGDGAGLDITSNNSITGLKSQVEVAEGRIDLIVSDSDEINVGSIVAAINSNGDSEVAIRANKINLEGVVTANKKFKIDTDGSMTATGGKIGGWNINDTNILSDIKKGSDGTFYGAGFSTYPFIYGDPKTDYCLAIGQMSETGDRWADANFKVTGDGQLYAKKGYVGGWTVGDTTISSQSASYKVRLACYNNDTDGSRILHCNDITNGDNNSESQDTFAILRNGEVKIGKNGGNQLRLTDGQIKFYYNDSQKGTLNLLESPSAIQVSGANLWCSNNLYIGAKNKYIYWYNDSTNIQTLGITSSNNLKLGDSAQPGDTYIYSSDVIVFRPGGGTDDIAKFTTEGLRFKSGLGILLEQKWAFRYYDKAVYAGIDTAPLKLVGSSITANGSSVTSDRRLKNGIIELDSRYRDLMDVLSAKNYRFNDYRPDVTNCGFIAQELLESMYKVGLSPKDFGAFVDVYGDESEYAIDYTQFIPILWEEIKLLRNRISELENNQ